MRTVERVKTHRTSSEAVKVEVEGQRMKRSLVCALVFWLAVSWGASAVAGIMLTSRLQFASRQTKLRKKQRRELRAVVAVLKKNPSFRLRIEAHTDSREGMRGRLSLGIGRKRAATVLQALVRMGITPNRLATRNYGPEQPIASNRTKRGRAKNRRVTFQVIAFDKKAMDRRSCLKYLGCRRTKRPPLCPKSLKIFSIVELTMKWSTLQGQKVAVRGRLVPRRRKSCTLKACSAGCCNRCSSVLRLSDRSYPKGLALAKRRDSSQKAKWRPLRVFGDRTAFCFRRAPLRRPIVVIATLHNTVLLTPRFCRLGKRK